MTGVFARVGRAVAHHPRLTVVAWLVLAVLGYGLAVLGVHGENLFDRLSTGAPSVPGSESAEGRQILEESDESGPSLTLVLQGVDPTDPEVATSLAPARDDLAAIEGVVSVIDPLGLPDGAANPAAAPLLAVGRRRVPRRGRDRPGPARGGAAGGAGRGRERLRDVPADLEVAAPGVTGIVGGTTLIVEAITDQVETDLRTGETIALPIALLIMILVFGGLPRGLDADGRGGRLHRRRPRGAAGLLLPARPRLVRRQHRDRARPRPLDRLGPADGVPVPRGAAPPGRRRRGRREPTASRRRGRAHRDRAHHGDRRPHGDLLRAHRGHLHRGSARLPAADPAGVRCGGRRGHRGGCRDRPDPRARAPRARRPPHDPAEHPRAHPRAARHPRAHRRRADRGRALLPPRRAGAAPPLVRAARVARGARDPRPPARPPRAAQLDHRASAGGQRPARVRRRRSPATTPRPPPRRSPSSRRRRSTRPPRGPRPSRTSTASRPSTRRPPWTPTW